MQVERGGAASGVVTPRTVVRSTPFGRGSVPFRSFAASMVVMRNQPQSRGVAGYYSIPHPTTVGTHACDGGLTNFVSCRLQPPDQEGLC